MVYTGMQYGYTTGTQTSFMLMQFYWLDRVERRLKICK